MADELGALEQDRVLCWFDNDQCPDPHDALKAVTTHLRESQGAERRADADNYLQLYLGSTRWSTSGYRAGNVNLWPWALESTPSLNVIQSITDTMVGMTLKQRVRPFFLTEGGNWEQREKAQMMQLGVEGQFRQWGIYDELGTRVCYDGNIFDGGFVKVICDYANHRLLCERVLPWQLYVPDREGISGKPRQMFHCYPMPRHSVLAMCRTEKERKLVRAAKPCQYDADHDTAPDDGQVTDEILVCEGWHLPSGYVDLDKPENWARDGKGKNAKTLKSWPHDGRHSWIIETGTLFDEPWPFDYFPIAAFLPYPVPTTYWSRSVPQTLCGLQAAMHRMNRRVDKILHLHARPIIYAWKRANINLDKMDNDLAGIIEGDVQPGQAIQYMNPTSVPGELVDRIRELGEWASKQFGVSDQSVQANRPPGIEHAPAMQHLQELETIRHTPAFRAWERMHTHLARITADMFRMMAEHDPDFEVMWGEDEELRKFKWKSVDLGAEMVRIAIYPTNLLPLTPGAKIERLVQMVSNGMLPPEKALAFLFEFPDLKAVLKDANAERRNIETKLGMIVKDGDYAKAQPNPYLNLDLAQLVCLEWINRMEADGLADKKLQMLRRWHRDVTRIKLKQMQAQVPPGGMAPPAPLGPDGQPLPAAEPLPPAAAPTAPAPAPGAAPAGLGP